MNSKWSEQERRIASGDMDDLYDEFAVAGATHAAIYEAVAIELACQRNALRDFAQSVADMFEGKVLGYRARAALLKSGGTQ